jgi:hypothetical protein
MPLFLPVGQNFSSACWRAWSFTRAQNSGTSMRVPTQSGARRQAMSWKAMSASSGRNWQILLDEGQRVIGVDEDGVERAERADLVDHAGAV